MWRKTRSEGVRCPGADPNRNFDFHWDESGTSRDECSEIYSGKAPFSEVESQNIANFVAKYKNNVKLYLTFHSYGQYILYPWGYDGVFPDNKAELDQLGRKAAAAIATIYGTEYTVGSSATALYPAAGGSDDWCMGVAGVPLTYTIELPGGGYWGFDLPEEEIEGVCSETWAGVRAFHDYIAEKYA